MSQPCGIHRWQSKKCYILNGVLVLSGSLYTSCISSLQLKRTLLGFEWTNVIPRPFISFVCSSTMPLRLSGWGCLHLQMFVLCWTLDKLNCSQIWLEVSQVHLSLPTGLHHLSLFLFQGCYETTFFQTYLKFLRHWQKLWFCWVLIVACAFFTDVDRLLWKS